MTRLRELWAVLCELLSGRLMRRVHRLELAVDWQAEHHARWEQELVRVKGVTTQRIQHLDREVGSIRGDIVKLSIAAADRAEQLSVEEALTFEEDTEQTVIIRLDE